MPLSLEPETSRSCTITQRGRPRCMAPVPPTMCGLASPGAPPIQMGAAAVPQRSVTLTRSVYVPAWTRTAVPGVACSTA